jgi:hypothetical protein
MNNSQDTTNARPDGLPACPQCQTQSVRKRSKGGGIFLIVFGILAGVLKLASPPRVHPASIFAGREEYVILAITAALVVSGVLLLVRKKYKCTKCGTTFQ